MTVNVNQVFALVDRKTNNFKLSLEKVTGKMIGNEYYVISVTCIINGTTFDKKAIVIGCPASKVEEIAKALITFLNENNVGVRLVRTANSGITLVESDEDEECSECGELLDECVCDEVDESNPAPGIFRVTPGVRLVEAVTAPVATGITPVVAPQVAVKFCPSCGTRITTEFTFCNSCGTRQP